LLLRCAGRGVGGAASADSDRSVRGIQSVGPPHRDAVCPTNEPAVCRWVAAGSWTATSGGPWPRRSRRRASCRGEAPPRPAERRSCGQAIGLGDPCPPGQGTLHGSRQPERSWSAPGGPNTFPPGQVGQALFQPAFSDGQERRAVVITEQMAAVAHGELVIRGWNRCSTP
jgi:hypothetical protein